MKQLSQTGIQVNLDRETILKTIAHAKQNILGPEAFIREDLSEKKAVSKIYRIYNESLKIQQLFDFEDLIFTAVSEMEADEIYRRQCLRRFQYVFVDEYQDLNHAQYRLLRALSEPGKDICVIGDPDQSIYGFRGSDYRYFINFINDYPEAKTVVLDRNYRSTRVILEAAFQVMKGHQLALPNQEAGNRTVHSGIDGQNKNVHILEMSTDMAEAEAVARTIEKMVGGAGYHAVDAGRIGQSGLTKPVGFSDVAVLYRTGDQHRIIAESLSRHGIPFQVAGGRERDLPEIKQLFSLFKVVDGSGSYGDFEQVVEGWQPGIGKETVFVFSQWGLAHGYRLGAAMKEVKRFPISGLSRLRQEKLVDLVKIINGFVRKTDGMPFYEKLKYLITHTRLERMIHETPEGAAICDRILSAIEENALTADAYFNAKALESDVDTVSFDVQKVTLMTLHAAKGLEFPVVFIVGCEDGLIPFKPPEKEEYRDDEERRLFFVGMTRAKEQLFLTWARSRKRFGKKLSRQLSPYVSDISEDLLVLQEPVYGKKRQQVQTQMKLF
jgi:superfamily I DNA/RNA helicase